MPMRSVLVGTDLSEASMHVVRTAGRLAEQAGADLHAVAVSRFPEQAAAAARLDRQLQRAVPSQESVASRVVLSGDPATTIRERAAEVAADLVVLGRSAPAMRLGLPFGGTASRVVRAAEVPCLVLGGPIQRPIRRIVVAVDVVAPSHRALRQALAWARAFGADEGSGDDPQVQILHVLPELQDLVDHLGLADSSRSVELLYRLVDHCGADGESGPPVSVQGTLRSDPSVAEAILRYVDDRDTDLLVIGTRPRSLVQHFLFGSVALPVVRRAGCPVLTVPVSRGTHEDCRPVRRLDVHAPAV